MSDSDNIFKPFGNASSEDYQTPVFPSTSPPQVPLPGRVSGRTSVDRPADGVYNGVSSRRPSEDRRRPSEDVVVPGRRSGEGYRRSENTYRGRSSEDNYAPSASQSSTSRRKPSQDTTRDYRRPSGVVSNSGSSETTVNATQSTTAASGMIIPNKSTFEEEYIKVPYGRERESGSISIDERDKDGDSGRFTDGEPDSASEYPMSPRSPPAGLSGLSARLKDVNGDDNDDRDAGAVSGRSGDEYFDINRSTGEMGSRSAGKINGPEDQDKMKRDYEYKISTMQSQISNLQRDIGDVDERGRKLAEAESRVSQMEEELAIFRQVSVVCSCEFGESHFVAAY